MSSGLHIKDEVFEAAAQFLSNGDQVPEQYSRNERQRFKFTAAMLRVANERASKAERTSLENRWLIVALILLVTTLHGISLLPLIP